MKNILIATKNKGKVADFKALFAEYEVNVLSLLDINPELPDVEETGETFEENAVIKAVTIANQLDIPVLADDSGVSIDYLSGRPGIYSARYAGSDKNDDQNNQKVLSELKGVAEEDRAAKFVCALAFARPKKETIIKVGICEGKITDRPIGENGFGYDPIFRPKGYEQTMAQLSIEEKNAISHRAKALQSFRSWLEVQEEEVF